MKTVMATKVPPQPRALPIALVGAALLTTGVVFYHVVEGLSWLDSLYFCVITLTTIGYGDITPHTDLGKIFTVFYVLFGISILAAVANYLLRHAMHQHWKRRGYDEATVQKASEPDSLRKP